MITLAQLSLCCKAWKRWLGGKESLSLWQGVAQGLPKASIGISSLELARLAFEAKCTVCPCASVVSFSADALTEMSEYRRSGRRVAVQGPPL